MTSSVQSAEFLGLPILAHLVLWPALLVWAGVLARQGRHKPWLRSSRLGYALAWTAVLADAATVATQRAQPSAKVSVVVVLWLAALLSVSAFVVLRAREDEDDHGSAAEPPEPPWWPEFERGFRDHVRGRSRRPAPRPGRPLARS
jgi:hypothetical protein